MVSARMESLTRKHIADKVLILCSTGFYEPVKYTSAYLTIRVWARDLDEVIVDEAEVRINYRPIEIERE